jgi:hypothetical protein
MIKTVNGIKIGDVFICNGRKYSSESFASRTSAVLDSEEKESGLPSTMKVPISELTKNYTII